MNTGNKWEKLAELLGDCAFAVWLLEMKPAGEVQQAMLENGLCFSVEEIRSIRGCMLRQIETGKRQGTEMDAVIDMLAKAVDMAASKEQVMRSGW